ncbi:MAG: DUF4040 domain-containing protein [Pseudohongiellaceae bacterium]
MELFIDMMLLSMLAVTALAIAYLKDLFAVVMLAGIYGLLSASLFATMDAVDVAFTEAAVGAGIFPLLMLVALSITGRYERSRRVSWVALALVSIVGILLIIGTVDMPPFGSPDAPAHTHVAPRYIEQSGEEIGIPNIVTSVLASYRAFDTFGEVAVVFVAGVSVLALLGMAPGDSRHGTDRSLNSMRQHKVLRVVSKILIPPIMLFALYVQFHGEYGPGGGFQAGVIFAAAIILYSILFGVGATKKAINQGLVRFLAAFGLLLYGITGVLSLLTGENYLGYNGFAETATNAQHIGILVIELGVGITVAAIMIVIFVTFSDRLNIQEKR